MRCKIVVKMLLVAMITLVMTTVWGVHAVVAKGEKVELEVWVYAMEPNPYAWRPVVQSFNKQSANVRVKLEVFPKLAEKISLAFGTGTAPDIVVGDPAHFSRFIRKGSVAPLVETGVITEEFTKKFYGGILDVFSQGGKLYALPLDADPGSFLILSNVDMFDKAGVKMPDQYTSWEHWMETAKKLTQYDAQGNVRVAGVNLRSWHGIDNFLHAIESWGGKYFDFQKGRFIIDNEMGLKSLLLQHNPVLEDNLDSAELPGMRPALLQGYAAMACDAPVIINLAKIEYPDLKLGVSMYPPLVKGEHPWILYSRGFALGINAQTKHFKAIGEFFHYFFEESVYLGFLKRYAGCPSTIAMTQDEYFRTGDGALFASAMATAPYWKAIKYMGDYAEYNNPIYWGLSQKLSAGEISPEEALSQLQNELNFCAYKTYK